MDYLVFLEGIGNIVPSESDYSYSISGGYINISFSTKITGTILIIGVK